MDYGQELQFGLFPTPDAAELDHVLLLAEIAEVSGLDLVTVQDHPYQARHLDAWTLLSVIAARSASLRVALNVANLPLRQPVVLAKSVATLDLVSGGRVELGLGRRRLLGPDRGGRRHPAHRGAERRRAPRGRSRSSAASGARTARPCRVDGEHHRVNGLHPGPGAGAPGRDLARRLQAPDAAAHRPVWPTAGSRAWATPTPTPSAEMNGAIDDGGRAAAGRDPAGGPAALQRLRLASAGRGARPPPGHGRGLGRAAGRADPRRRA